MLMRLFIQKAAEAEKPNEARIVAILNRLLKLFQKK